jgi:predicted permease
MSDEIRAHLELQAAENERRGMSPEEARFAAQRAFGGVEQIKERARDERRRGFTWLEHLLQDARYALRSLKKNPGFTAVVVFTLSLSIALNTVVFSLYSALTLRPLPVRAAKEIVRLNADPRSPHAPFTAAEFEALQTGLHSVNAVIATSPLQVVFAGAAGTTERQRPTAVQLVSMNFFAALGVPARLGRTFTDEDTAAAVMSYDAWQREFNGDAAILGHVIRLQGVSVTIIGVAPPSFGGVTPPAVPDFWLPMAVQPQLLPRVDWLRDPTVRIWELLARRQPGVTTEQVAAEVQVVARSWLPQADGKPLLTAVRAATYFELHGPEVQGVGLVLLLAVGLILLVGGVNVVNLIAARNTAREHEIAIRLAVGASRGRIVRQLCTESVILGLLGGAGALLVAWWACALLHVWTQNVLREMSHGTWSVFIDLTPDARVFAYAVLVSLATGVLVGLRPAWRAASTDIDGALKLQALRSTGGPRGRRHVLLTIQVAASMLLLGGAGLLLRGAARAIGTEPGFDAKHLLTIAAWSNLQTIARSPAEQQLRARQIEAELRRLPDVASVASTDRLPFVGHSITPFITDENRFVNNCVSMRVDADYFATLGLLLVAGRGFTADEVASKAPVVIITESTAQHLWPGADPLGRRIAPFRGRGVQTEQATVIGVLQDARFTLLSKTDPIDLFFPQPASALWLVRTRGAPQAAVPSVLAALRTVDPALPSQTDVGTMEDGPMHFQRLMAQVPAMFASLLGTIALVLAEVGIHGVVSFVVARRTREIGVRLALGATKSDVVNLILRQTLRPAAWGAALGALGAVAIAVLLTRLVLNPEFPDLTYGAGAFPTITLVGVAGFLTLVILIAAYIPARRAAKVDPVIALRAE